MILITPVSCPHCGVRQDPDFIESLLADTLVRPGAIVDECIDCDGEFRIDFSATISVSVVAISESGVTP